MTMRKTYKSATLPGTRSLWGPSTYNVCLAHDTSHFSGPRESRFRSLLKKESLTHLVLLQTWTHPDITQISNADFNTQLTLVRP